MKFTSLLDNVLTKKVNFTNS